MLFEQARQGEDVAHVVVDDEHFLANQGLVGLAQSLQHLLLGGGKVGRDQMQEQWDLVEQPLRRLNILQYDALGHPRQANAVSLGQVLSRANDDRQLPKLGILADVFHQLKTGDVRQPQVENHAVELGVMQSF